MASKALALSTDPAVKRRRPAAINPGFELPAPPSVARRLQESDCLLEECYEEIRSLKRRLRWIAGSAPTSPSNHGPGIGRVYNELIGKGFDPEVTEILIAVAERGMRRVSGLRNRVRLALAEAVAVERPEEFFSRRRTISVFAGAADVGTSSTIGKIAGYAATHHRKRVAVVLLDPSEAQNCKQPLHYRDATRVPVYTSSDAIALLGLIGQLEDDVVLIDASAADLTEQNRLNGIKALTGATQATLHIGINADATDAAFKAIMRQFAEVGPCRALIMNFDEAPLRGGFVSNLIKYETPVSFVTGQRVPDQLWAPTAEDLANWVLPPAASRASVW
jgi:flagellar biosynthesis GTPase FlhF